MENPKKSWWKLLLLSTWDQVVDGLPKFRWRRWKMYWKLKWRGFWDLVVDGLPRLDWAWWKAYWRLKALGCRDLLADALTFNFNWRRWRTYWKVQGRDALDMGLESVKPKFGQGPPVNPLTGQPIKYYWMRTPGGILLLILLMGTTLWLGRHAYHFARERHDAARATAYLAQGDLRNALFSARTTLLLNASNVPACRVMADLAARAHSRTELDWRGRIAATQPTVDNQLNLAAAGLRCQPPPFPLATQILDDLAGTAATNRAFYQALAARLALDSRRLPEAEAHFAAAARLDPTNTQYSLNLAVFRLGLTNITELQRDEARARLVQLRLDAGFGPAALRALIADRLLQTDAAGAFNYSTQLLANAQATLADQLQNLRILQQLASPDFTNRLQAVQQQAATNAVAVAEVSTWMQANGLAAQNFHWLQALPDPLRAQLPVQLALAGDYQESGDWQGLRDLVSQGNWGKLEFLRFAIAAHASAQLGLADVAAGNWGSAVNEADHHLEALQQLLELAAGWQLKPEQAALLERIVRDFPQERRAVQSLTQVYFTAGDTAALNRLYARMTSLYPTNADYQNNLTVTALLLQTNLSQAKKWAAEAYARTPGNPHAAAAYAYALHLQHQDEDGLAVLAKLPPAELAQPSPALYYGLLLTAAGKPGEAASWLHLAQAKPGMLLPEEKQLLASSLGAAKSRQP